MSEQHEKLAATVKELENELHSLDTVDDETRTLLDEALQEIHVVLNADGEAGSSSQTITDRLHHAAQEFESTHPTVAGAIARLIDGLVQIGI